MDGNDLSTVEVLSGLGAMPGVPTCAETANMEQVSQMITKIAAATLGISISSQSSFDV